MEWKWGGAGNVRAAATGCWAELKELQALAAGLEHKTQQQQVTDQWWQSNQEWKQESEVLVVSLSSARVTAPYSDVLFCPGTFHICWLAALLGLLQRNTCCGNLISGRPPNSFDPSNGIVKEAKLTLFVLSYPPLGQFLYSWEYKWNLFLSAMVSSLLVSEAWKQTLSKIKGRSFWKKGCWSHKGADINQTCLLLSRFCVPWIIRNFSRCSVI